MALDDILTEIEQKRVNALTSCDPKTYFIICEESGIKPEDLDLYLQGCQEVLSDQEAHKNESAELWNMFKDYAKQQKKENYIAFLKEVSDLGIQLRISKNPGEKRRIIKKYFPRKYESQGFDYYSTEKLGKAFLGFVDYAKKQKNN